MIAGNAETTGLEEFLKSFNLEIGPGLIVDPRLNYNRRVQLVFAPIVGTIRHPIVDSLANRAVLLPYRGADPHPQSAPRPTRRPIRGCVATPILRTSAQSWVETDLQYAEGSSGSRPRNAGR